MTTLKPHLLRADTIDLQSHENPSAKDHSRQPIQTGPYGYGHAGPHHAQALRHANEDAYHERRHSPRLAEYDHGRINSQNQTHLYDDTEDEDEDHMHDGSNGVMHHDGDSEDGDGNDSHDEDLDDDLLDKISSSPSIEDGKRLPARADSADCEATLATLPTPTRGFPFVSSTTLSPSPTSNITPPHNLQPEDPSHHPCKHKSLENNSEAMYLGMKESPRLVPSVGLAGVADLLFCISSEQIPSGESSCHLLPADEPLLAYGGDEQLDEILHDDEGDWEDEDAFVVQEDSSSDDDQDNFNFTPNPRFLDSGWGGECLRETEDIDFEFVYALHTFVATVEGQANATKGDTMVLLDDSNSYWWLVRVVKDGSIGYLPAEHIETPTERLARLNKHRNIDLAASMLGDNAEKSKNPLKKAMRRRNAKTVNFAAPIYYEPSERDWSDDEEHDEDEEGHMEAMENGMQEEEHHQQVQHQQAQAVQMNTADAQRHNEASRSIQRIASDEQLQEQEPHSPLIAEESQAQSLSADAVQRSRKGVVRNTDSFFKDDSVETKKISLTPRLLRGDSDSNGSAEQEARPRPSLDTFDRITAEEKQKDTGKKKEKKGMLSGLFKRKDKSGKGGKGDADEVERVSEDSGRSPQSKDSMDSLSKTEGPERKPSKLQKSPPALTSPKSSQTEFSAAQRESTTQSAQQPISTQISNQTLTPPAPTGPAPAPPDAAEINVSQESTPTGGITPDEHSNASHGEKRSMFAPITDALRSKNSQQEMDEPTVKPVYSKRAKERFAIDESDSEDDSTPTAQSVQGARDVSPDKSTDADHSRSDSAMGVSTAPVQSQTRVSPFAPRSSSKQSQTQEMSHDVANQLTPVDTDGTAPSEHTASTSKPSPSLATHTPSTSRSTPTWSDASLRTYMDDDQDVRDLLIIVHDKSNITPVEHNHPLMNGLFSSERTKLAEMQSQLDSMLTKWISKKRTSTVKV